jgi:predicted transcriptional regulator
MPKTSHLVLSRRESQIMEALFRLGEGSVSDVLSLIDDPPGYNSIRTTLGILENKGLLVHRRDGAKYVYRPREPAERAATGRLDRLVRTFFGGSRPKTVAALLDNSSGISEAEYRELTALLRKARSKSNKS